MSPDPSARQDLQRASNVDRESYLRHEKELRRFLAGVVRDRDLASDLVQSAILRALERGGDIAPESRKAWLFQVGFRLALEAKRRKRTEERAVHRLGRAAWAEPPEEWLERKETLAAVRKALDVLPPAERAIVVRRIFEEQRFAQIAGELDLPLGTVLSRMRRALARLREALQRGEQ